MSKRGSAWLRVCVVLAVPAVTARDAAALGPDELVLVYNTRSRASRDLAKYYAARRGVGEDRLCGIDVVTGETCTREEYDSRVVPAVRGFLRSRGLEERCRCLVTFYRVPIRVGSRKPTAAQLKLASRLDREYAATIREFQRSIDKLDALGREQADASAKEEGPRGTNPAARERSTDYMTLLARYAQVRIEAQGRLHAKWESTGEGENEPATRPELKPAAREEREEFWEVLQSVDGVAGVAANLRLRGNEVPPLVRRQVEAMRALVRRAEQKINELLAKGLENPARDEARWLIRKYGGLRGLLMHLDADRNTLRGKQTQAAFDSELSLLWQEGYPQHRWIVNTLSWRARASAKLRDILGLEAWRKRVLMVSRLDGPTARIVRRMIDDSIAVEKTGLAGRIYADARGLPAGNSYGVYDENIRRFADLVRNRTDRAITLDDRAALFGPGRCPDAGLYVGWYSLRKYVDAFDFLPGAVAVHIASGEAVSLRGPLEQGWCKKLLEDGAAATMGPVAEPYLASFPLPRDFFGLLMTGRYTLAECYYFTASYNSWMLMLLGDPLYRPFAVNPALAVSDVFEPAMIPDSESAWLGLDGAATRPATGTGPATTTAGSGN